PASSPSGPPAPPSSSWAPRGCWTSIRSNASCETPRSARSAKGPARSSGWSSPVTCCARPAPREPGAAPRTSGQHPDPMKREILINATPQETRVAILEDDVLVELMVDRPDTERIVGDIYLGQVEAVLPGIQAAFVDIGTEKAAFLHVSDVARDAAAEEDEDEDEGDSDKARRYPPIQELIQKGQRAIVQVSKEPIGT